MDKLKLMKITNEVRKDIVTAVHSAKAGHPGGSLSAASGRLTVSGGDHYLPVF